MSNLPNYLHNTLIGLLLSDGKTYSAVRLSVIMLEKSYPYILHLYNIIEPYINFHINILNIKSAD